MNKLFKILPLAIAIIAMLYFSVASASTLSPADGALSLSDIGISGQPIIAGSNITITFQLFNSYSQELTNVNLYLNAPGKIVNISPSSTYLISAIGEGLYGGSNFDHFIYKFHIPSTLTPGTYTIYVNATYQSTQASTQENTVGFSSMPISFYVYGVPNITVSGESINILPDAQQQIPLEVSNIGTGDATNITIKLMNSSILTGVGSNEYSFGSMSSGSSDNINFLVQTNVNITNSTYPLNLQVNYTNSIGQRKSEIISLPLSVVVNSPNIVASIYSSNPQQVFAGSNQTLNINFQNIGLGEAKNVTILFLHSNSVSIGNPSYFFIPSIAQEGALGSSANRTIFVQITNESATEYTLQVVVNYSSSNYKARLTKVYNLTVSLEPKAVFQVTGVSDSIKPGQSYSPLTLQVVNTGNEAAQHVSFTLETIYPISTIDPNQYSAQLAPGQSENITFYVSADTNGNPGNYPITLYEQWTQSNLPQNQQLSGSNNYYISLSSPQSAVQSISQNKSIIYALAVLVIICIIALRFYSGRRKRHDASLQAKTPDSGKIRRRS